MTQQKRGVRSAKGVARADHAIQVVDRDRLGRDVRVEQWWSASDGTGSAAGADGRAGHGEFDEAAASERVTEAAFPSDERCIRKSLGQRGAFQAAGFQRAGTMAFQPDAPAGRAGAERSKACGETGASAAVRGEVVHFVVETWSLDRKVARVARENRERRAIAETDRAGGAVGVGRGKAGVENLEGVESAGDERADEIEREDQRTVRETGMQRARGHEQSQMRGYTRMGDGGDVGPPAK